MLTSVAAALAIYQLVLISVTPALPRAGTGGQGAPRVRRHIAVLLLIGITVLLLLAATWASTAGAFLA